jgi:hypothetical protein
MTCEMCCHLAAKSERQWKNRQAAKDLYPEVSIYTCRYCGSQDWATTREFIAFNSENLRPSARPWWQFWRLY